MDQSLLRAQTPNSQFLLSYEVEIDYVHHTFLKKVTPTVFDSSSHKETPIQASYEAIERFKRIETIPSS
ncbi:hypothetical protein KIN20_027313 [Parelaphostrongylus tenuis]|uniref:Uncharacterized protein n=1 Tax=Parelaphostrongylus tenuis TaxID=148309 RepID=A0AAD5QZG1_PARTN|nr:hypothetical protein KIN20_027313 [Parelaphostrongylus tenuis]